MKHFDSILKTIDLKKIRAALLRPELWMWLVPVLLIVPNVGLTITEYNSALAKATNLVLPFGVYLLLCSLSAKLGRTVLWMIPLMIFAAFQIVLLFLFGESIIAIDMFMNVMTTNVGEATELLANLKLAIFTVCMFYLPPIGVAIYFCCKKKHLSSAARMFGRKIALWIIGSGLLLAFSALCFADSFNPRRELFPYNVCENMVTAIARNVEAHHYDKTSADFSYQAKATHPDSIPEVYVMVIGETSRAANWQLTGYDRPTNPCLSMIPGVVAFDKVLTEINTTHKSVPMLMSWLTAETFGENVAKSKSIFSAFNDLGFKTAFFSNQRRNNSYIDFYGSEAQMVNFISDDGGSQLDDKLLRPFAEFVENADSNKLFIILHTYGSHFEYNKHYTKDAAVFKPDHNSEASPDNREQLINAYDNTIVYTDKFLASLIEELAKENRVAALMYVSDHGEDIFDDARHRFLHASPVPTYWQMHVPMIVWTSDAFNSLYPEKSAALRANSGKDISSSASFFQTMLDLAGIKSPYFNSTLSVASSAYRKPQRFYLNDYNEAVSLEFSGLREYDIEDLNELKISIR